MPLDRKIYFDSVRQSLFHGEMSQSQVDGQNYIISQAEVLVMQGVSWIERDMRWLAYCLATTYHETAQTMMPIEEYGKGKGQAYGKPDPQTGETYYGRGFVMLSWRDNYAKATKRLGLSGTPNDLEWHADSALIPWIAASIMFQGMSEGWFRSGHTLPRYFDADTNDAYNAREIVNGDKTSVPSWSNGQSIGALIAGYHQDFLEALTKAWHEPETKPEPAPGQSTVAIDIKADPRVTISVTVNGIRFRPD